MNVFLNYLPILYQFEGDFDIDPHDDGNYTPDGVLRGTKKGISSLAYPNMLKKLSPAERALFPPTVQKLTDDEIATLYEVAYWNPICGDDLPERLAIVVFDAAVNSGVYAASTYLQHCVHVETDGVIGPRTLAAVQSYSGKYLLEDFTNQRIICDVRLNKPEYLEGWISRAIRVLTYAKTL